MLQTLVGMTSPQPLQGGGHVVLRGRGSAMKDVAKVAPNRTALQSCWLVILSVLWTHCEMDILDYTYIKIVLLLSAVQSVTAMYLTLE